MQARRRRLTASLGALAAVLALSGCERPTPIVTLYSSGTSLYDEAVTLIVDDASYVYLYNPQVVQAWTSEVQGYEVRADRAIRFRDTSLSS